jgi:hypothetical protein
MKIGKYLERAQKKVSHEFNAGAVTGRLVNQTRGAYPPYVDRNTRLT